MSLFVFGVVSYAVIAVPIGRRTLFEHALHIARTKPAQELAEDVGAAAGAAVERARTALR